MRAIGGAWRGWRGAMLVAGLAAVVIGQMTGGASALSLPGGGHKIVDPCEAERAPILERQKQYEAIRRSHLGQALGEGLKKGAIFFGTQMMSHYMGGLPGIGGLSGHPATQPQAAAGVSGLGGLLSPANLGEAGKLTIPGVTAPAGVGFGGGGGTSDTTAIAAMAVVVAIVGTVEAYVQLKQQEAGGDNFRLATSIDDDARRQIDVNHAIATEEAALSSCRAREVADYKTRLSGAGNTDDRHSLARDRTALQTAIKKDVDLTGGVVDQQAGLAKNFTQGRAMAEGKSEADVLGGQAPAYEATASTTALKLPPPPAAKPGAAAPAPTPTPAPPPPTWSTTRPVAVRASASPKAAVVANLAAGAQVEMRDDAKPPEGWYAVKTSGKTGYVRTTALAKVAPAAPVLAPPSNIREHNRAVLAARDQGPSRLKTLLTDVEAMVGGPRGAFG